MILLDATGYGHRINDLVVRGVKTLMDGLEFSLVVNKTVGNGVVHSIVEATAGHETARLCAGNIMVDDTRIVETILKSNPEILIIDEAEQLDRLPEIADAIHYIEDAKLRVIYVMTVVSEAQAA